MPGFMGIGMAGAAEDAAEAQVAGQQRAIEEQRAAEKRALAVSQPWLQGGQAGLNALLNYLGLQQEGTGAARAVNMFGVDVPDDVDPNVFRQLYEQENARQRQRYGVDIEGHRQRWGETGELQGTIGNIVNQARAQSQAQGYKPRSQAAPAAPNEQFNAFFAPIRTQRVGPGGAVDVYEPEYRPLTAKELPDDPGYQFRLQQGTNALERSAAARGGLLSGQTLKGLTDYSQGMASQEFANAVQRRAQDYGIKYGAWTDAYNRALADRMRRYGVYSDLSGTGANVAAGQANIIGNTGQNIGNLLAGQGEAKASGILSAANAQSNVWNNLINLGLTGAGVYAGGVGAGAWGGKSAPTTNAFMTPRGNYWDPSLIRR